jgi:hypothetical protein
LGYTFAYFDFDKEKITNQHFIPIEASLKADILKAEADTKLEENKEFKYYDLLDVSIDSLGNIYTLMERRELEINAYKYDSEASDMLKEQVPKMGQVVTSTLIFSKVDDYFHPMWTTFFVKYQSSDMTHGLNNTSVLTSLSITGERKIFYASSRKGVFLNSLNFITIGEDGKISEPVLLKNEESLTPVLPYCYFNNSSLIFVGKKGFLGKKTFITNYSIDD